MRQHYLIYRNRLLAVTWRPPSSSVVIKITRVGLLPHVSPTYKIWGTSVSVMTDLLYKILRDLSEISRGEGRWKTGEGRSFLSPSKGRVMKKMTGKEGGTQKIKPPRSLKDALIYTMFYKNTNHLRESWHAIISWHTVQPPLSGHNHLLAIPMRVFFVVISIKRPCIKSLIHLFWLYFKNTMKENTVRDRSWHVWAYALCIMALGWGVMVLIITRLQ